MTDPKAGPKAAPDPHDTDRLRVLTDFVWRVGPVCGRGAESFTTDDQHADENVKTARDGCLTACYEAIERIALRS